MSYLRKEQQEQTYPLGHSDWFAVTFPQGDIEKKLHKAALCLYSGSDRLKTPLRTL